MSRFVWISMVLVVLLLAMAFAAANAGHRVTLSLGFTTFYQIPVTLVAFSGLFVGMLVMFATGIHSDLKVRRILRERLADETHREQTWIDRDQKDLFAEDAGPAGPADLAEFPEDAGDEPGEDRDPSGSSPAAGPVPPLSTSSEETQDE